MKIIKHLVILFLIIMYMPNSVFADEPKVRFLEPDLIFSPPLAFPRSSGNTSLSINTTEFNGEKIKYFSAIIGKNIPIITLDYNDLVFQLCAEGSGWLTLGYKDMTFPLLTEDFLIGIPLSFRYDNLALQVAFRHISAHRGDGMESILENSLSSENRKRFENYKNEIEEDDLSINIGNPITYSRDFITFSVSYDYRIKFIKSRTYSHIGYAHKMIPETLKRWFIGSGYELMYSSFNRFLPYFAHDITWNEDTDSTDLSFELGVIILSSSSKYYTLRFALTRFIGKDRRGQMLNNDLDQFGFGFFIY